MGSYTTNFALFKAAPTDFVDVTLDVDANMSIIDTTAQALCRFAPRLSAKWAATPGVIKNTHKFSTWRNDVRSYDGQTLSYTGIGGWEPTICTPSSWNDLSPFLINSFVSVGGQNAAGYRLCREDMYNSIDDIMHVEFCGRVALTGFAAFALGTQYLFSKMPINGSAVGASNQNFRVGMGNSPASATNWNAGRVCLFPSTPGVRGQLAFDRDAGTSPRPAMTPGSSENYFSLDNIRVRVSRTSP
jgi:hypothetical protein